MQPTAPFRSPPFRFAGRIFPVASAAEYQSDARTILSGRCLKQLWGEPAQFKGRLSAAYRTLLGRFWSGESQSVRHQVGELRKLVEGVDAAAVLGPAALAHLIVDEKALGEVESSLRLARP